MHLIQMITKQSNRFLIGWRKKKMYNYYDEYDFDVAYNNTFSDDEVVNFDDLTEGGLDNE